MGMFHDNHVLKFQIIENKLGTMGRDFDTAQDILSRKADLDFVRRVDHRFDLYTELGDFK